MVTTTFVLGAAANFGIDNTGQFPVGSQLAVNIQNQIASELAHQTRFPQGYIGDALSSGLGGINDNHVQAMRRIEDSIVFQDSIDDLVNEWNDLKHLKDVAKICIAVEILKAERSSQISAALQGVVRSAVAMRQMRESWLGKLIRYANPDVRRRDAIKCFKGIRFVTFNYDRLLEAALLMFLRDGQDIPIGECQQIIDSIDIYHAYGDLGTLSELGGNLQFGSLESRDIYRASLGIRTYSEEIESIHSESIRNCVNNSDNIIFLGFGFHDQNMKLLFGDHFYHSDRRYIATSIGLEPFKRESIKTRIDQMGGLIDFRDVDCHTLLEGAKREIF